MKLLDAQTLKAYASALLQAGGYASAHAERTADILVWANARGANSHGVLRIPRYIEMVETGLINPTAVPKLETRDGAIAVLDAAKAPGPSAMVAAMDTAIGLAEKFNIGWCSARDITHAGAVGYFALRAAERGYIGIVMTASGPLMAYHGSKVSGLSTNPISISAPSNDLPLLLDMSTSTAALGKIMHAKDAGTAIPPEWAIDANGNPVTDPSRVATLTPLGGPKGSGLSLMIEVLCSVLVANPVISTVLGGGEGAMNGAALAIKIDAFGAPDVFANQIAELGQRLKGLPKAPGTEEIFMPGERGFHMSKARMQAGIPLTDGTLDRLTALGDRLGVAQPETMQIE
ncbi:Ldh family oxidoreductase [Pacificibacter marinus]|uniref:Putative oxidoreductase YjmC n=1 Tax=Pacificibacter marinus TaxID=658057 RepID=A0A1Y5RWV4_9RHOB|nr:Ldh family oxidoreductase [Pacificibacter marinus]SEK36372.1 ureidoglycolate dehydrogenase (NAD+) [Pacificibacter marinus]SLN26840.1 putative oxidoreductase YjmC [Pacificibacter marinus]